MTVLDEARQRDRGPGFKLAIARALGLKVGDASGTSAGSVECPACNAVTRHTRSRDKRGAIGVAHDGRARCHQCGQGFDAIGLVAYALDGGHVGPATLAFLGDFLGLDGRTLQAPRPLPEAAPPAPAPTYPALEGVEALWNDCEPLGVSARAYLEGRGLDARAVVALDVVRQLPRRLVAAAPWSHGWARSGHELVFDLVDSRGEVRSVLSRLGRPAREGERKSLAVSGYARAGLVVACPRARAMLASACHPSSWTGPATMRIVLCEGELDALAWATSGRVDATIGIFSGSLTAEHARRLAFGARVLVATDLDEPGEKLASGVLDALRAAKRTDLRVSRWRPAVAA